MRGAGGRGGGSLLPNHLPCIQLRPWGGGSRGEAAEAADLKIDAATEEAVRTLLADIEARPEVCWERGERD